MRNALTATNMTIAQTVHGSRHTSGSRRALRSASFRRNGRNERRTIPRDNENPRATCTRRTQRSTRARRRKFGVRVTRREPTLDRHSRHMRRTFDDTLRRRDNAKIRLHGRKIRAVRATCFTIDRNERSRLAQQDASEIARPTSGATSALSWTHPRSQLHFRELFTLETNIYAREYIECCRELR